MALSTLPYLLTASDRHPFPHPQSLRVNRIKHDIDDLSAKLAEKRAAKGSSGSGVAAGSAADETQVIDEEEFALIRDTKAKKKEYQKVFEDRKLSQNELAYLKGLVQQTQVRLCNEFLVWFERTYHVAPSTASMASISMVLTESDAAGDGALGGTMGTTGGAASTKGATMAAGGKAAAADDGDQLDDGEQFEKLQKERVMGEDPDAFAFFAAKKQAAHSLKQKGKAAPAPGRK